MIEAYTRHSPSSLNLFAAQPAMFVLEKCLGIKQTVGVPAHRGTAVEDGVRHGLLHPEAEIKDCVEIAHAKYDLLTAISGDKRKQTYRDSIPYMIEHGLYELKPYGIPAKTQGYIQWKPAELALPIVGYFDFSWDYDDIKISVIVDLKTSERMPSEIKVAHARQVALYTVDGAKGRLCYVTPKKSNVFELEDDARHREALLAIAQNVESFLTWSDDPLEYTQITVPDLDSFYWSDPASRELAYKYWRV